MGKPKNDDDLSRGQRARLQLLESAAELFAEQGEVSVRAIAERAGINHGLVHYYFGSKQGLRAAAFEYANATASGEGVAGSAREILERGWVGLQDDGRAVRILLRSILEEDDDTWTRLPRLPIVEQLLALTPEAERGPSARLVAEAVSAVVGWYFLGRWLAETTGLDEDGHEEVTRRVLERSAALLDPVITERAAHDSPGAAWPMAPRVEPEPLPAAQATVDDEEREGRGWGLLKEARALMLAGELRRAWDLAAHAAAIAKDERELELEAHAEKLVGALCFRFGHVEAALEANDRARGLAAELPSEGHEALRLSIATHRASMLRGGGRLREAADAFAKLAPRAQRAGDARLLAQLRLNQASTLWQLDEVSAARVALDEAGELVRAHELWELKPWLHALGAWVAAADERYAEARRSARAALRVKGDESARASAVRALAQATTLDPDAELADFERAHFELTSLAESARSRGHDGELPLLLEALADLEERRERPQDAVRWLREAIAAQRALDEARRETQVEAAQLRMELARLTVYAENLRLRSG